MNAPLETYNIAVIDDASDDELFKELYQELQVITRPRSIDESSISTTSREVQEHLTEPVDTNEDATATCPTLSLSNHSEEVPKSEDLDPEEFQSLADAIFMSTNDAVSFNSSELVPCKLSTNGSSSSQPNLESHTEDPNGDTDNYALVSQIENALKKIASSSQESQDVFSNLIRCSTECTSQADSEDIYSLSSIDDTEEVLHVSLPSHLQNKKVLRFISPRADRSLVKTKDWMSSRFYKPERFLGRVCSKAPARKKVRFGYTPRYRAYKNVTNCGYALKRTLSGCLQTQTTTAHNVPGSDLKSILKSRFNANLSEELEAVSLHMLKFDDDYEELELRCHFQKTISNTGLNKLMASSEGEFLKDEFLKFASGNERYKLLMAREARHNLFNCSTDIFESSR